MASTSGGRTTSELLSVRKGTEGYVCPNYMATKRSRPENDLFGLGVGTSVFVVIIIIIIIVNIIILLVS